MKQDAIPIRNWKNDLLAYLPQAIRGILESVDMRAPLEEIRIRAGKPLQLCFGGYERLIYLPNGRAVVDAQDCRALLRRFCEQSVYAWETELGNGFLTLPGGYRVGLCGAMAASEEGRLRFSEVTAFDIRIARQVVGAADGVLPQLVGPDGRLRSTLIVSPPGCGKTTMLRDLARSVSYGVNGARAARVAVVDTRYELSGCARGVMQMDLGPRTDVLTGVSRADGMRMMVTNMSPEALVTDELSTADDMRAVWEAKHSGVTVAASAHAGSLRNLLRREAMRAMLSEGLFSRIVLLSRSRGIATVEQILDENLQFAGSEGSVCCAQLPS